MRDENNYTRMALALIMALAFILRFESPTLVEFKRDEPTVTRLAQAIAYEGYLPAVGVNASVGMDNLPLNLYLMAIPLRLWNDPLAAVLFTMLLNWLAVWGCYLLGRLYFDPKTGLIAALLFAVNPWAVLYARKIWSLSMPWATEIFFVALYAALVQGRRYALVLAMVGLSLMLGLHLSGLAAIPILLLAVLLYRDQVSPKMLRLGTTWVLLTVSPYILHDVTHHWENMHRFLAYADHAKQFSWDALRYALELSGSTGIAGQAGPYHEQFRAGVINLWWMNDVMIALLIAALGYAAWQAFWGATSTRRRTFGLLLIGFFVPIVLQLNSGATTQLHYFVVLYPVQFILIAALLTAGVRQLSGSFARGGNIALLVLLLIWSGWQGTITRQLHHYMAEHPSTGGYGIPLKFKREAAQAARQLAKGAEIIVLSQSNRPFMSETPTVFDTLLFGRPHRFCDGRTNLPVPDSPRVVYLVGPIPPAPESELTPVIQRLTSWPTITEGPRTLLPDGISYRTFIRQSADRNDVTGDMTPIATGIPLANHIVFAAYNAQTKLISGSSLTVWLAWWVQGMPPAGRDYHFTAQLLDSTGILRTQEDHAGFPTDAWRVGDLVLSRFVLPVPQQLPPGTYQLRVGMYRYPDIVTVPVISPSGTQVDDAVTLTSVIVH